MSLWQGAWGTASPSVPSCPPLAFLPLPLRLKSIIMRHMNTFIKQFRNGDMFPWERSFTREALRIAIPIVTQSMFMALLHIIDNLMIGHLGELELAAVTQANRITFLFNLVVFGLSSGTATYVAQYWGKRDLKGIRSVMGLSLSLSLVAALLFVIPCLIMPRQIIGLLLRDETAAGFAVEYLSVIVIGYIAAALTQCFATVQKSTEQARLPMAASITALLINTSLNYCLIFGKLGFPRLGVLGGALATVIAQMFELGIVVIGGYLLKFATAARFSELIPRSLSFARKYLAIAAPVILNEGLWSLGIVMYSVVYGRMGTAAVASVSIYGTVEQVAFVTMRGLTSAAAVLIGKRIGAGDDAGAQHTAKRFLYAALPSGLLAGVLLLAISLPLATLFNVSAPVLKDAQTLVRISASLMWINQLAGLLIVGIMRSGGDVNMSLLLDAGAIWAIGVPLVALGGLALGLSLPQVMLLSYIESAAKVILGLLRFRSGKWIHNLVR